MALSTQQAHDQAGRGDSVIGWKLDRNQRAELLQQFPPHYPNVDADHVTLSAGVSPEAALPSETVGEIVGRVDDGKGVEAMVVKVGGTVDRPDGSIYHITWSLLDGREARESNDVLRERAWQAFDLAMPIELCAARWR
jgi:hypothetical protein